MSSIALAAVNVKSEPTASFSGASVTLTGGEFSGLGNVEAIANLTATGEATYTCEMRSNAAPGRTRWKRPGSSGPTGLGNSDHNGRHVTNLEASVTAPNPTAKQVGCGGSGSTKWKVGRHPDSYRPHLVITQKNKIISAAPYCRRVGDRDRLLTTT
jgi:hypothetical protein